MGLYNKPLLSVKSILFVCLLVVFSCTICSLGCSRANNNAQHTEIVKEDIAPLNENKAEELINDESYAAGDISFMIETKKLGFDISKDDMRRLVNGIINNTISDSQLSALLMSIRLNGMNSDEISDLTYYIKESGETYSFNDPHIKTVDMQSTGGVADPSAIIAAPIVAACGGKIPMLCSENIGFTGGITAKLASIPGFSTDLTPEEIQDQLNETGLAFFSQTPTMAPALQKLFALRNETSTIDSIPLIASSILGRKLAANSTALVFDVKTGTGAYMKTGLEAEQLARTLLDICNKSGVFASAVISDMNQPLGQSIGDSLEIKQVVSVLSNKEKGQLYDLSCSLAEKMLIQSGVFQNSEEASKRVKEVIENGTALKKLKDIIYWQGGDPEICNDPALLPQAPITRIIRSPRNGYLFGYDLDTIGQILSFLKTSEDEMENHSVGLIMPAKIGDQIREGQEICIIHALTEEDAQAAEYALNDSIYLSQKPTEKKNLIYTTL